MQTLAIADFRGVRPGVSVVELVGVGLFCQEKDPEVLVSNIVQFLQSTHGWAERATLTTTNLQFALIQ